MPGLRAILFLALALSLVLRPADAQQPQMYRSSIKANWIGNGDRFWYRINTKNEGTEFILVDAKKGTRRPAFDHDRLAKALSIVTSKNISKERLPIDSLSFSDTGRLVISSRYGKWRLNEEDYKLTAIDGARHGDNTSRFFLPPKNSVDKGGDVTLRVSNELAGKIQLVWIDRSGQPKHYQSIDAGATVSQHTFVGHVWGLKGANGKLLAAFEAYDDDNVIVVNDAALAKRRSRLEDSRRSRSRSSRRSGTSVSPDGLMKAVVRHDNLWLANNEGTNADSGATLVRQLTTDATEDNSFRRDASRARLLEGRHTLSDPPADTSDVRWSPDSRFLVAFQTTKVSERRVQLVESTPRDQFQPKLNSYPYAKPGDSLPIPRPRLFAANGGQEIPVSTDLFSNPFKLSFLKWSDDSSRFYLLYNERGHQSLRVLEVSAKDGAVRAIVDENSDTFIHYSTSGKFVLEWLPNQELLWASERSGWNHLYRYDLSSGRIINAVTSGEWNVRRVQRIDTEACVIWFYAVGVVPGQDPYHEHFCQVNLDGSGLKVLTKADGTHSVTMSPTDEYFIDKYSRVDLPPVHELRRSEDGSLAVALEEADASDIVAVQGKLPTRFTAMGRDGKTGIWGIIHWPRYFDPNRKYPVVENIYAGPHDHHVPKAFRTRYRHQRQIADSGMIVVQIDGMGTAWRSKAFHDVCYRNLKDAGFPDRIAWMKAAAEEYPCMDLTRVGIYGGSAGGQNAMAALLWHGTFYKAAVADCGCHDNRMDKLWWNEQWMGWPVEDHYAANSNSENAHLLQGSLMLVVGELDRNVDPASTTKVLSKLVKAGKDFDFLLVPGAGHGACETAYASRRRARFLAQHLGADVNQNAVDLPE